MGHTYNRSMPTYEYACSSCGTHIEVFQRFNEEPLTECGVCGGSLRKVFHPAGILFKGTGFYKTESRSAAKAGAGSQKKEPKPDKAASAAGGTGSGSASTGSSTSGSSTSSGSGSGSSGSSGKEQTA
jgi:putative FmdB family regulatory protein